MPLEHIHEGIQLLSDAAIKASAWAEVNLLSLNVKKTKAIVFGTPHAVGLFKKLDINNIVIKNKGNTVPFVDEVLSLGVILDDTLSWKQHVDHISKKVKSPGLRFIKSCTS